jgi:hypothetical protein
MCVLYSKLPLFICLYRHLLRNVDFVGCYKRYELYELHSLTYLLSKALMSSGTYLSLVIEWGVVGGV